MKNQIRVFNLQNMHKHIFYWIIIINRWLIRHPSSVNYIENCKQTKPLYNFFVVPIETADRILFPLLFKMYRMHPAFSIILSGFVFFLFLFRWNRQKVQNKFANLCVNRTNLKQSKGNVHNEKLIKL